MDGDITMGSVWEVEMKTDTEIVAEITDFLVNNFGDEDDITGQEAKEMLSHICDLIDQGKGNEKAVADGL